VLATLLDLELESLLLVALTVPELLVVVVVEAPVERILFPQLLKLRPKNNPIMA
jgi:hypothetical protein